MKRRIAAVVIVLVVMIAMILVMKNRKGSWQEDAYQRDFMAMDTYMTITAYGPEAQAACDAAVREVKRLEDIFSTNIEESDIAVVNAAGSGTVSKEVMDMLLLSKKLYKNTDGAFDIAIFPVVEAWGFAGEHDYKVPEDSTIQNLLTLTDMEQVSLDESSGMVSFAEEGMKIDLGGIAKGYTSQRLMALFSEYKITSAMVSLGGNVQTLGAKPDGNLWHVGIRNPEKSDDVMGVLEVKDLSVITSGGYERYFEEDGKTYHHIIDPKTGYPAQSGLLSTTVISSDGTLADALSTALYVMGKDRSIEYWRAHSDEFDMILCDEQGVLWVTEGIAGQFKSKANEIEVVSISE